jgi:hypothetical protein
LKLDPGLRLWELEFVAEERKRYGTWRHSEPYPDIMEKRREGYSKDERKPYVGWQVKKRI